VGAAWWPEDLAVFGIVLGLDKDLDVATPAGPARPPSEGAGGRRTRADSGLGDVTFIARYTAYQDDHPGETLRLAPFVGLEAPTGDDDENDLLGRLPQPLQLGSGSWEPFKGVVGTWQTLNWQIDVAASYKFNAEAYEFEFGDEARNEMGGEIDRDSGGVTWYLAEDTLATLGAFPGRLQARLIDEPCKSRAELVERFCAKLVVFITEFLLRLRGFRRKLGRWMLGKRGVLFFMSLQTLHASIPLIFLCAKGS